MKRVLAIALAVLAPIAVVLGVLALEKPGLPAGAQSALDSYLRFRGSTSPQPLAIERVVPAAQPWSFDAGMSGASFGDGIYYHTTYSYQWATQRAESGQAGAVTPPFGASAGGDGLRALPFPPRELWCALLAQADGTARQVVYVALHQDMYNAAWAVHEPAEADLQRVGCGLEPPD